MPNYVYCTITLTDALTEKQSQILGDIEKAKGIARYYVPMPSELANSEAVYPETEESIELEKKYGYTSWYPWALEHWGTKWGCCGFTIDGKILTFSTAWSALKDSIINQFAQDFPNFTYMWEEEQGFGAYREYIDGEWTFSDDWDLPSWGEHPEIGDTDSIGYLTEDYSKMGQKYPRGFYAEYDLENYLGDNPNTVFPTQKD